MVAGTASEKEGAEVAKGGGVELDIEAVTSVISEGRRQSISSQQL